MKLSKLFSIPIIYIFGICSISILLFKGYCQTRYIQIFNMFSTEKIEKDKKKLVCIILTTENNFHTRGLTVWNTYGKKCDQVLFSCNCSNFSRNKNYNDIPFLQLNVTENYHKMDVKVIQTLKETYKIYNKSYYWFLLVDDDTYVFVDNAKRFNDKNRLC
jgi:hypothetical protein